MRSKFKWIFTLLLAFTMQFSFAQEKTVTGVVSDATGPLPGANVVVKGAASRSAQTDVDGKFSIKAKAGEVLLVTFTGYNDSSVTVGAANSYKVTLVEASMKIEEVLITGALGIKKRPDAQTSSTQLIKSKELNQAASSNAVQGLIGKVSGLNINTTNSGVNATTRIVIRGNKSITQNNQALVVIDGANSSATVLAGLDPDSIDTVNVLKGAQGAALYGSDGANGVIVVTTKRGSGNEKLIVKVSSSLDFEQIAFTPTVQTRYGQGWNGQNVSYENGAWGPEFDGTMVAVGLPQLDGSYVMAPFSSRGSDNIKDFFKTGTLSQNRVSLSSGTSDGYFYFSAENQKRDFVIDGDTFGKSSFLFKTGKKVGKFTFDGNASYTTRKTSQANAFLYDDLVQTATNIPIKAFANSAANRHWTIYTTNPYWSLKNDRSDSDTDIFNGIAKIQFEINPHINVVYNANVNVQSNHSSDFTNAYTNPFADTPLYVNVGASHFSASNTSTRAIYSDLIFNFDYKLSNDVRLKMNIGNNIQDVLQTSVGVGGNDLAIEGLYNINYLTSTPLLNGANTYNSSSRVRKYSYFGNADLSYKDYLFLNVTGRNDWTSVLASGNNSYFYPSAGLSFVPTKAIDGLKGSKMNNAKIYFNYTKVGKADIGAYAINSLYSSETGYPLGGVGSYIQNTGNTNPNLRPEFYTTKELGVNLAFFDNRLTIDAAAFRTDSKDLITNISPSYASGFSTTTINIGKAKTEGFEIDLGFSPLSKNSELKWDNRLSFSTNKMTVLKVSDQQTSVSVSNGYAATANYNVGIFAEEGEQFPLIKGQAYERDDQGRVIIDASTGMPLITSEYVKLGVANPDYTLGYNASLEYKGVRLAAVFDYRHGGSFYSQTMNRLSTFGYLVESAQGGRTGFIYPNSVIESTTVPGTYVPNTNVVTGGNTYSSYLNYNNDNFTNVAENFVLDATAFKVREIALSYTFSKKLLSKSNIEGLTVGINARNPFIVLPKENRGYSDPESSVTSGNAQGFQYTGQYPSTKSFGFSVNLTF